jgi:cyclopropane fatty-acyl-phospholipid synthase-like methyltransferase
METDEKFANSLTTKQFWDNKYRKYYFKNLENILYKDIFNKYLHSGDGEKCLEIGCYPGHFLLYLTNTFNYIPFGLDYTEYLSNMSDFFQQNGIKSLTLYNENFEDFDPGENFDLVCSFGFIEHFQNYEEIIKKHISLVKPGGYLIISCPNFTHFPQFLHKFFDYEYLKKTHNFDAMNLEAWEKILKQTDMKIIYHNYYRTIGFWSETDNIFLRIISLGIHYLFSTFDYFLNYPNKYTSPYMISISQKKEN